MKLAAAALCIAAMTSPALAEENPAPSRYDARMRYVAYNPGEVVHLSTAVGMTLVVGFGADETVTAVAVTDSKDLAASPRGHFLFFKSKLSLPSQPIIVLTSRDGGTRRYVFDIVTTRMPDTGPSSPDLYYSVQFVYPADQAARRHAAAVLQAREAAAADAKEQAEAQAREAQNDLELARLQNERRLHDPFSGTRNWRYVAQGDRSLLPFEVFDNGYSTVFRFPANVRIPSIFAIDPDGKEATPNYSVKGDLVQLDHVARGWRLRDGDTVLCIWNRAYDPVGSNPGTNTTSPVVQRVVTEAPK